MQRQMIDNPETLEAVRKMLGARDDWHEPDEQGIEASFTNIATEGNFDNAFCDDSEMYVSLYDTETCETVAINLAMLLAWATGYRG